MANSRKNASGMKTVSTGISKKTKSGKKPNASPGGKKNSVPFSWRDAANQAGGVLAGKLLDDVTEAIGNEISEVFVTLIMEGWFKAAPLLADIVQAISFAQYSALIPESQRSEEANRKYEYDRWMESLLLVAVVFSKKLGEIKRQMSEFEVGEREISDFMAEELIDRMWYRAPLESEDVLRLITMHCLTQSLERNSSKPKSVRKRFAL